MERIVVGVDGSAAADAALRWAGRLAARVEVPLTAVHCYRRPYIEVPPDDYERMLDERATLVGEEWVRSAREAGVDVSVRVVDGDPRQVIEPAAHDEGADLLVLGRTGRGGGPGFLHLGSVVEHVVHHTSCPLAVIPSGMFGPTRRIVLGVDGSAPSAAAVAWCTEVAPRIGAMVVAVTVAEPSAEWNPTYDPTAWRRGVEAEMAGWTAPLAAAGVKVDLVVVENLHPADGLLGLASAREADLLVLGTRGAGGAFEVRVGGVAIKVLHGAALPLVLVPAVAEG